MEKHISMNSPQIMLVGGLIRIAQGLIAATPTLLVGLLIAAILRYYLGRDGTRRLFGGDSIRALPQSWLIGMLLPVCSIGVLPILIQMRRLAATMIQIARDATGVPLLLTLIALLGLAVLAAALPFGLMQHSVERDDPMAPLTMLTVAVPVYATPMLAMSQLGMMFQHANSPGAAFTLLILGTGMNFATPLWFGKHYGWKAAATWLVGLSVIVIAISYVINKQLVPPGVHPAGHTHAFDIYANPLSSLHQSMWATAQEAVLKQADIAGLIALAVLAVFVVIGLTLRALDIDESSVALAVSPTPEVMTPRRFDVIVPRGVVGATMLAGLVTLSVVACFAYYPSPQECLKEISLARGECLSAALSGDKDHALFWLPVWEEWSRRLEVGTFLRRGELRRYQSMQAYLIRKKLELLERELEHEPYEREEVQAVVRDIFATNSRWVRSFQN